MARIFPRLHQTQKSRPRGGSFVSSAELNPFDKIVWNDFGQPKPNISDTNKQKILPELAFRLWTRQLPAHVPHFALTL